MRNSLDEVLLHGTGRNMQALRDLCVGETLQSRQDKNMPGPLRQLSQRHGEQFELFTTRLHAFRRKITQRVQTLFVRVVELAPPRRRAPMMIHGDMSGGLEQIRITPLDIDELMVSRQPCKDFLREVFQVGRIDPAAREIPQQHGSVLAR